MGIDREIVGAYVEIGSVVPAAVATTIVIVVSLKVETCIVKIVCVTGVHHFHWVSPFAISLPLYSNLGKTRVLGISLPTVIVRRSSYCKGAIKNSHVSPGWHSSVD